MKKIRLGTKKRGVKYDFRETCFGIVYQNEKFYLTEKNGEISLKGGGIETGENHIECLKREFIEESGLTITNYNEFITIDCFWITRNNKNMESLANFYITEVSDKIEKPTEELSKLITINSNDIISKLDLPYQKEAIKLYLEQKMKK